MCLCIKILCVYAVAYSLLSNLHLSVYVHNCVCVCVYVCVFVDVNLCVYVCMYTFLCMYTSVCVCKSVYIYVFCVHICMCMQTIIMYASLIVTLCVCVYIFLCKYIIVCMCTSQYVYTPVYVNPVYTCTSSIYVHPSLHVCVSWPLDTRHQSHPTIPCTHLDRDSPHSSLRGFWYLVTPRTHCVPVHADACRPE